MVLDADLPAPIVNRHREGHRVDFAWPRAELVVETDGRATHDNPYAFHVIRLSWSQVVDEPERVRKLLCRRAHSLSIQSVQRSFE